MSYNSILKILDPPHSGNFFGRVITMCAGSPHTGTLLPRNGRRVSIRVWNGLHQSTERAIQCTPEGFRPNLIRKLRIQWVKVNWIKIFTISFFFKQFYGNWFLILISGKITVRYPSCRFTCGFVTYPGGKKKEFLKSFTLIMNWISYGFNCIGSARDSFTELDWI